MIYLGVNFVRQVRYFMIIVIQISLRIDNQWLSTANMTYPMFSLRLMNARSICKVAIEGKNMSVRQSNATGNLLKIKHGLKLHKLQKSKKKMKWVVILMLQVVVKCLICDINTSWMSHLLAESMQLCNHHWRPIYTR